MASPFRIFRKHQRILIAVLGLMAMIAFVFLSGPVLDTLLSGSARNPVRVETAAFGDLHLSEIDGLRTQRQVMLNFLARVKDTLSRTEGARGQSVWMVERFLGPEPLSEEAVVDTWLYAKQAERLGVVITNDAINAFIREITEDRITKHQLGQMVAGMRVNQRAFFEVLRHELLAMRLQMMFETSLRGATPGQRWDYYTRLKRQARVEVLPVPVASFTDEIETPDESTLRAFFEAHKDDFPYPSSPEPGFHQPHRVALRYLMGDPEAYAASDVISEEEVRQYYEENKAEFDRFRKNLEQAQDPAGATEQPPAETVPTEPAGEAEPAAREPAQAEQPHPEPASAEPPSDDAPAETDTNTQAADEVEATESEPAEAEPTEAEVSEGDDAEPEADQSSSRAATGPFRLAAFEQEQPEAETTDEEAAVVDVPAEEQGEPAVVDVPADEVPAEKQPVAEQPAEGPSEQPTEKAAEQPTEQPAEEPTEPSEVEPASDAEEAAEPAGPELPTSEPSAEEAAPADAPAQPPKDPLEGPLGDLVRQRLARQKIIEAFAEIEKAVAEYRGKHLRYNIEKLENGKAEPPEPLDLEVLAAEHHLSLGETPLISQFESQDYPIGRSYVDAQTPFPEYAFDDGWPLFLPAQSFDLEGNHYLFWKVDETEERIPEFDDPGVREQVLHAWKMVQAREPARKRAEQLAQQAREADGSLEKVSTGEAAGPVEQPPEFTWLTRGNVPSMMSPGMRPRLSEVPGVEMPGDRFMQTVFDLAPGEIGVAMNEPETIAYVIRAVEFSPSTEVLWAQFEGDSFQSYADVAFREYGKTVRAWEDELKQRAGLKWVPLPEQAAE